MKDILFSNDKVEKYFNNIKLLQKKCGMPLAKQIVKRMSQLEALENVYDLLKAPIDNPHLLEENLEGCIAWSLTGNIRLILDTGLPKNPENISSLANIEKIIIKGVVDYHGNKNNWIIC